MVAPHAQVAVLSPPLEQKVQQWKTPVCLRPEAPSLLASPADAPADWEGETTVISIGLPLGSKQKKRV